MKLRVLFVFMLMTFFGPAMLPGILAQAPSRVAIRGNLLDPNRVEVVTATVMLLNPTDSTLITFTATDRSGNFRFANVRNTPYLLKVSHISHMPLQIYFDVSDNPEVDLGSIELTPFSQVLMQVVVREAKAPIRISGDTVEYDVSSFKVPPGSTVEDLLKRLPGIEVDAAGNISSQGRNVRRITVDGKTFFGDDPQTVTQNLGSEAVSRVQVFDERTEQSRLTGIPDASRDRAMNLELKEEYKKGTFGKVTAAGGSDQRWAARANYNRFDENRQFSVIGYGNNINQSGVNWSDYQEFRGQTAFTHDNGDFGFEASSWGRYRFSSDVPIARDSDRGYSNNAGAGTNYNYHKDKLQFNLNYFYSQSTLFLEQFTDRQTFLPDTSFRLRDTLDMTDFRGNHSFSSRFENQIDSTQRLIARVNLNVTPSNSDRIRLRHFSNEALQPVNEMLTDDQSEDLSLRINSLAIYSKRFKKSGRSFAVSGAYNFSHSDAEAQTFSLNRFFAAEDLTAQIRQLNVDFNQSQVVKSSLLFTEGLSNKWFAELFYNFSASLRERNNEVTNPLLTQDPRIDSLSLLFKSDLVYNRAGAAIKLAHRGTNLSIGAAVQHIGLTGSYAPDEGMPWSTPVKGSWLNITPNVNLSQQFPNRLWLRANYGYEIDPPSISDLYPAPVINNPLYRNEGNPNLDPEKSHSLSASLNYWAPATFASYGAWLSYNIYEVMIVQNIFTEFIDSLGYVTTTRPENMQGGDNFSVAGWTSVPIIKTKLTMNLSGSFRTGNSNSLINNIANETYTTGYSGRLGFSLTPGEKLHLSVEGRVSFSDVSYSIQSQHNQKIENHSASATIRYQFIKNTFFESNFSYNLYRNDRFGFDTNIPLLNGSVRRIFGKNNRFEARIAVFDLFNKRLGITQSGSENFILQTTSNTLARYYMLSLSYNLKGFEAAQKGRRGRKG
jgi:hypothetical protein